MLHQYSWPASTLRGIQWFSWPQTLTDGEVKTKGRAAWSLKWPQMSSSSCHCAVRFGTLCDLHWPDGRTFHACIRSISCLVAIASSFYHNERCCKPKQNIREGRISIRIMSIKRNWLKKSEISFGRCMHPSHPFKTTIGHNFDLRATTVKFYCL